MDIKSLLAIAVIKSLRLLSLSGARRLGALLAGLMRVSNSVMYRTTQRNIALCYPQLHALEQERLVRESVYHTACSIAETGVAWAGSEAALVRNAAMVCRVEGERLFLDALAAGNGVMLITLHMGNWEWLAAYLPARCKLSVLYKMAKMPYFERWMLRVRQRGGVRLVNGTRAGVESFIQDYCTGGTVLFAPDQEPSRKSGIYAPFFGIAALTPKLPHDMIQCHPRGKVLYTYVKRVASGFELVFREAPQELFSSDLLTSATALNRGFEQCIADAPAQNQWDYKRFKRRPDGERNVYK